ncbi:MAG: DUF742 domain-containing protein, partial [Dactylosporangium sp.]|nr:DUF742 domain-containing protein [Dactylosporangium sp.]NNJ60138.1 DUF742 domain-containing protein [Dactylosporangium sp.]
VGRPAADPEPMRRPEGVRPFVLTRGRVSDDAAEIGLETQVTMSPDAQLRGPAAMADLVPEFQTIVFLCAQPMSVAEISAQLGLHLGVTKVLVNDLRATGHLEVHCAGTDNVRSPDTILRVIHGLRALS